MPNADNQDFTILVILAKCLIIRQSVCEILTQNDFVVTLHKKFYDNKVWQRRENF